MLGTIYRSFMATVLLAILLCGVYPLVVTGFGKLLFSDKASGGIITLKDGRVVGARLIGQSFSKPEYFHGRPSAAGDKGYDASNSSGSNLGPTNQKLYDGLKKNVDQVLQENPGLKKGQVPTDLVTASASGLDPHITPDGAYVQAQRVASARKLSVEQIKKMIEDHIEGPQWGSSVSPVVNVLALNLDLDEKAPLSK